MLILSGVCIWMLLGEVVMRYPKGNARNRSMMAATCDRPVTAKPNIVNAIITLPARSLTPLRAYLP